MPSKKLNSHKKVLWLITGSIILCSIYLGFLIYTSKLEISSAKTNGIATFIFIVSYFGLFAITKHIDKGLPRINKKLITNLLILMAPFIITGALYIFIKSVLILLFVFIFCQIMITIYYNNFMPVPGYPKAYKLFKEQQYEKSITLLTNILSRYPKSFETLILIANAYIRLFEYENAIIYLLRAEKIDPENVTVHINLANAYTATEDFQRAIESSEKIIHFFPENWNALYSIGLCSMFQKNYTKAITFYTKTLEKEIPEAQKFLVHYGLYTCQSSLQNEEECNKELDKFKSFNKSEIITFWKNQLEVIKDKENKPSIFVKDAINTAENYKQ